MLYVANVDEASAATGNAESAPRRRLCRGAGRRPASSSRRRSRPRWRSSPTRRRSANSSRRSGLDEPGLARVIRAGYALLDLITFFTVGPKEARAWTVAAGHQGAAGRGRIHTDFEKGFIRAETIAYADFVAQGGEQGAKDAGKMRLEGADYVVQDGDIIAFPLQRVTPPSCW